MTVIRIHYERDPDSKALLGSSLLVIQVQQHNLQLFWLKPKLHVLD